MDIISPELLLGGYESGFFPMADSQAGEIKWYCPDPRGIIPLDGFKIPRSLRQTLRRSPFDVRVDTSFESVIRHCAEREETWISEKIIENYVLLHRMGHAHSVESWRNEELVGGLYGASLGAAFFGESMFSRARDASKICLVHLVQRLKEHEFELLDTQFITPHLARFGAIEIPRDEYLRLLRKAVHKKRFFFN